MAGRLRAPVQGIAMTKIIENSAFKIATEIPRAEQAVDSALLALSGLIGSLVQARRDTGVPPSTGQASLIRLTKVQTSLVSASSDILRVHGELLDINREFGGLDVRKCPESGNASKDRPSLSAVA